MDTGQARSNDCKQEGAYKYGVQEPSAWMGTRRGSAHKPRRQGVGRAGQGRARPGDTLGTPDLAGRGHEARGLQAGSPASLNVPEGSGFWGTHGGKGDFHATCSPARQQGGVGQ